MFVRTFDKGKRIRAGFRVSAHDNSGNSSTSQQQAVGSGASNQNNTAQVNGSGFTAIDQDDAVVSFTAIW